MAECSEQTNEDLRSSLNRKDFAIFFLDFHKKYRCRQWTAMSMGMPVLRNAYTIHGNNTKTCVISTGMLLCIMLCNVLIKVVVLKSVNYGGCKKFPGKLVGFCKYCTKREVYFKNTKPKYILKLFTSWERFPRCLYNARKWLMMIWFENDLALLKLLHLFASLPSFHKNVHKIPYMLKFTIFHYLTDSHDVITTSFKN